MEHLVSIIIPTFNARRWLGEAVDSALGQSYRSREVIVVDDGSTDGTGEWLNSQYGDKIRYLSKSNGGLSSARNVGLSEAQGEYIQFLDSDDFIDLEKVATHVAHLDAHPETDVAYGHSLCFDDGEPDRLFDWPRCDRYADGNIFGGLLYPEGYILTHATLSRRASLMRAGGFDESLSSCVDWDYWMRVAWSGARFTYVPGPAMSYYRVRVDQMSGSRPDHALNGLRVLEKVAGYVDDPQERKRIRLDRARGHWRFRYGRSLAESGRMRRGLYEMALGVLADRTDLDYKLSFMALSLVAGSRRAAGVQRALKRAKARLVGSGAAERA